MRINKEKIVLPIDEFDKPDYAFMEQYVKQQSDPDRWKCRASDTQSQYNCDPNSLENNGDTQTAQTPQGGVTDD